MNTILASKTDVKTINFKNGEFYSGVWTAYSEWHCMSFWGSRILIKCNYEKNLVEHNYWNRHLIGVKILKLNDYLIFMQNIFLECEQLKSNTVFWLQIICLREKKKRESRFSLIEWIRERDLWEILYYYDKCTIHSVPNKLFEKYEIKYLK